MRTFTPPAGRSTRLSHDVWELLCTHAAQNGNSSTREALEQLIRQTLGTGTGTTENTTAAPDYDNQFNMSQNPSQNAAAR